MHESRPGGLGGFLAARYDEAEAEARDLLRTARRVGLELQDPALLGRRIPGWYSWPEVEAACAARLAGIAVSRAILAEHASSGGMYPDCRRCERRSPGTWHGDEEEGEEPPDDVSAAGYPCRTVRLLGTEFSGHAAYEAGWAP